MVDVTEQTYSLSKAKDWLAHSLGFDLRSLALLRVSAPLVYLIELLLNWQYIGAYLTDQGLLTRTTLFQGTAGWSVYLAVGTIVGAKFLYICHMLALVSLILGFATPWSSLACYIFTYSLQHRFPALPGWETEIRMLFLIGCFLPWGEFASLDSYRNKGPISNYLVVSPATIAWRTQIVILYLFSGLLKSGSGWADGTAVEGSLASDAYSNPAGLWFLSHCQHYPGLLETFSFAVPLVEIFCPLLLLSPWPALQILTVIILWTLHAGFGLFLHIGMFSPICCVCLLAFVPSSIWDSWHKREEGMSGRVRRQVRTLEAAFLGWIALSMFTSALDTLPECKDFVRASARGPWVTLGLEQHWGMFVPPPFEGGWHIIKGRTVTGEWVDLMFLARGANDARPEWVYTEYPGVRGYLFIASHLREATIQNLPIRESVAEYYRTRWENAFPTASDRISDIEIQYYKRTYTPGKGFDDPKKIQIYSHHY